MPSRQFHFGPQPALDQAVAGRRRCEQVLAETRKALAAERGRLSELERITGELQARLAGELDRLSGAAGTACSVTEMAARSRFVDSLTLLERRHRETVAEQLKQVAWAEQKARVCLEALNEAVAAVQALEAVKNRMLDQHRRDSARKEARKIEDAVIARHKRRSPLA
jgi:hypothetical protein